MDPRLLEKLKKIYRYVGLANYGRALSLSVTTLKSFPDSFEAQRTYASILADAADYLPSGDSKKMKKEAVKQLKMLTKRLRGKSLEVKGAVRNEYFYHSGQYKKQYELGVNLVGKGDKTSYFSQGVGAAWYSYELKKRAQNLRAKRWAGKAIAAWKKYLKVDPNYYNSYVHLALAHGIYGDLGSMEKALEVAAIKSKKPRDYFEFEKVRSAIATLCP